MAGEAAPQTDLKLAGFDRALEVIDRQVQSSLPTSSSVNLRLGDAPSAFEIIEVAALMGLPGVLDEHAIIAPRIVARRRRPGLQALRDLGVIHVQVDGARRR